MVIIMEKKKRSWKFSSIIYFIASIIWGISGYMSYLQGDTSLLLVYICLTIGCFGIGVFQVYMIFKN